MPPELMNDKYCRTLHYKVWVEGEILHIRYSTDEITLPIAKQAVEWRMKICEGMTYPILADIRSVKSVEPAARKFLAGGISTDLISAGAFLINNQFHKVAGNFFIQFNKPKMPTRLFTCETEARAWLQQYKDVRMTG
jgi:hypothetical protein